MIEIDKAEKGYHMPHTYGKGAPRYKYLTCCKCIWITSDRFR